MGTTLVLVTHVDGTADDASLQAATLARRLADGGPLHAVLIGPGAAAAAPAVGAYGVSTAHVAETPALESFAPDAWSRILADLAERLGATAVVGPGTDAGNDVFARLAARIDQPFAANCLEATPGNPISLVRARWGGSLLEEARLHADRALLTVVPHALEAEAVGGSASVETFAPQLDEADLLVRVKEQIGASTGGVSLADARIVISGGRGVGSPEGFAPIEELAGLLGAAVGCSRAVTIAGWRNHTDQVGQTGTKIAPEIYIACGISGATQHMAGVKGAKRVLAINKDPEASIMFGADYAVIGDLLQVVPAISAEVRRVRGA